MTRKYGAFRLRAAWLRAAALAVLLVALPGEARAADAAGADAAPESDGQATQSVQSADETQMQPQPRDEVWGTMHENMYMGTDPETGDSIVRVGPRPKVKDEYENTPVIIEPRIEVPVRQRPHRRK